MSWVKCFFNFISKMLNFPEMNHFNIVTHIFSFYKLELLSLFCSKMEAFTKKWHSCFTIECVKTYFQISCSSQLWSWSAKCQTGRVHRLIIRTERLQKHDGKQSKTWLKGGCLLFPTFVEMPPRHCCGDGRMGENLFCTHEAPKRHSWLITLVSSIFRCLGVSERNSLPMKPLFSHHTRNTQAWEAVTLGKCPISRISCKGGKVEQFTLTTVFYFKMCFCGTDIQWNITQP